MKECCAYCLTTRRLDELFQDAPSVWYCRIWADCKASFAKLPDWMRV